jgi:sigma-B regulation protein RsbU (phosphoserine phosphatase)
VDNLTKVTREKERISTELDLAKQIQENMLPSVFPPYPDRHDLDIHASMDPAKAVGGDFYDFFLIDEEHLGMVMADVSGKGIPAALFMMMARIMINSAAKTGIPPSEVLRQVNERICENNDAEMFVTVWLGILNLTTGEVTAANAGHEYPMLRGAKGDFVIKKDPHGFVVGGMEGVRYRDYSFTLERGGTLFLYTDGLPEANDKNGKLFGTDRILEVLNRDPKASAEQLLDTMTAAVAEYVGKTEQFDDLTMMAVRLLDLPKPAEEAQNVVEKEKKNHKK